MKLTLALHNVDEQARPITTGTISDGDERLRYLSLHRSFENLKGLKLKIENELIPSMEEEAEKMSGMDISSLSDLTLADEIARRESIYVKWEEIYKDDCIPFAHGMRLFGQVYNDIIKPKDPFDPQDWRITAVWPSVCTRCLQCIDICPENAISIKW